MRMLIATLALLIVPASVLADSPPGRYGWEGGCCAGSLGWPIGPRGAGGGGYVGEGRGMSAAEHGAIFNLLSRHATITRTVTEIPGGARTTTTTTEPELVATLRIHVRQMARRLEQGRPVRMWDPVFQGVFAHSDEITLSLEDIDGGLEVTETSENPAVVPLIRAHAAKVSAFAAGGHARGPTPMGRRRSGSDEARAVNLELIGEHGK